MKLGLKGFFKRGQKGFTLVELMVVMAIMAVLSAIVVPAVSGTAGVSKDSAVRQDASSINNAVTAYYGDQTGARVLKTDLTTVVPGVGGSANATNQVTSSRYPEAFMTTLYPYVFKEGTGTGTANVTLLTIYKFTDTTKVGTEIVTPENFVNDRNALLLTTTGGEGLFDKEYIPSVPKSSVDKSNEVFNNYLWVVKRNSTRGDGDELIESRVVEVFKLTSVVEVTADTDYELTYEQIY